MCDVLGSVRRSVHLRDLDGAMLLLAIGPSLAVIVDKRDDASCTMFPISDARGTISHHVESDSTKHLNMLLKFCLRELLMSIYLIHSQTKDWFLAERGNVSPIPQQ